MDPLRSPLSRHDPAPFTRKAEAEPDTSCYRGRYARPRGRAVFFRSGRWLARQRPGSVRPAVADVGSEGGMMTVSETQVTWLTQEAYNRL